MYFYLLEDRNRYDKDDVWHRLKNGEEMLEIERKFLMEGFPKDLELLSEVYIEQGYVSFLPEVRIRKAVVRDSGKEEYYLTIKGEGDLARREIETEISRQFYEETADFLGAGVVKKDYKKYKLGQLVLEVSLVDADREWAFYYGEIEFPSEEEANAFEAPDYFGKEITYDAAYKMKNFWKRTRG